MKVNSPRGAAAGTTGAAAATTGQAAASYTSGSGANKSTGVPSGSCTTA